MKKKKVLKMPLKDLVEEHEKLTKVLKHGDRKELDEEFNEQNSELKEYKEMEKAHIKEHERKTSSGKLVQVKEHEDKRTKHEDNNVEFLQSIDNKHKVDVKKEKINNIDVYSYAILRTENGRANDKVIKRYSAVADDGEPMNGSPKDYATREEAMKDVKNYLGIEKTEDNELGLFIDLEKAKIKFHTKKIKTGKIVNVKEHEDKRPSKKKEIKELPHMSLTYNYNEVKDIKQRASIFAYSVLSGKEDEMNWTNEMWRSLPKKYKKTYLEIMSEPKIFLDPKSGKHCDAITGEILEKSQNDELGLYIEIEKSNVKAHTAHSKTGKLVSVKQYSNLKVKKNQPIKEKKEPVKFKTNAEYAQMKADEEAKNKGNGKMDQDKYDKLNNKDKDKVDAQRAQQNGQQQDSNSPMAKLDKEKQHLEFMMDKYPDLIDSAKVTERMKKIVEAKRKIEDILMEVSGGSYSNEDSTVPEPKQEKKKEKKESKPKEEKKTSEDDWKKRSIVEQRNERTKGKEEKMRKVQDEGMDQDVSQFKTKDGKEVKEGQKFNINKNGKENEFEVVGSNDDKLVLQRQYEVEGTKKFQFTFLNQKELDNLDNKKENKKEEDVKDNKLPDMPKRTKLEELKKEDQKIGDKEKTNKTGTNKVEPKKQAVR